MEKEQFEFFKQIVEEYISFQKFLGIKLVELRKGYAKILVPYRDELIGDPRSKRWHGGVISAAMDSVGGTSGATSLTSVEDKMSTIDIRIDYLSGTRQEDLVFEGHIVRSGNRIVVTKMHAYHPNTPNEIVAEGKAVFNVRRTGEKN